MTQKILMRTSVCSAKCVVIYFHHLIVEAKVSHKYCNLFLPQYSEKDLFSDLRVEIDRELASKHPGYLRSKASIVRSSGTTKVTTKTKSAAMNMHESALLAPSNTRQMPRCAVYLQKYFLSILNPYLHCIWKSGGASQRQHSGKSFSTPWSRAPTMDTSNPIKSCRLKLMH